MRDIGSNYGRLAPDQHIDVKEKPVSARVSGDQADQLEALADASNMTVSTYLRLILQKVIDERWVYQPEGADKSANEHSKSRSAKRTMR